MFNKIQFGLLSSILICVGYVINTYCDKKPTEIRILIGLSCGSVRHTLLERQLKFHISLVVDNIPCKSSVRVRYMYVQVKVVTFNLES